MSVTPNIHTVGKPNTARPQTVHVARGCSEVQTLPLSPMVCCEHKEVHATLSAQVA